MLSMPSVQGSSIHTGADVTILDPRRNRSFVCTKPLVGYNDAVRPAKKLAVSFECTTDGVDGHTLKLHIDGARLSCEPALLRTCVEHLEHVKEPYTRLLYCVGVATASELQAKSALFAVDEVARERVFELSFTRASLCVRASAEERVAVRLDVPDVSIRVEVEGKHTPQRSTSAVNWSGAMRTGYGSVIAERAGRSMQCVFPVMLHLHGDAGVVMDGALMEEVTCSVFGSIACLHVRCTAETISMLLLLLREWTENMSVESRHDDVASIQAKGSDGSGLAAVKALSVALSIRDMSLNTTSHESTTVCVEGEGIEVSFTRAQQTKFLSLSAIARVSLSEAHCSVRTINAQPLVLLQTS